MQPDRGRDRPVDRIRGHLAKPRAAADRLGARRGDAPRAAITLASASIEVKGVDWPAMLGPLERKTLNYQIQFIMRGYYQVGPMVLETGDLFGLTRRFRIATEPVYVLVYPKVVPCPATTWRRGGRSVRSS